MMARGFLPVLLILARETGFESGVTPPGGAVSPIEHRQTAIEAERLLADNELEKAIPLLEQLVERNPAEG